MGMYVTQGIADKFGRRPGKRIKKISILALSLISMFLVALGAYFKQSSVIETVFSPKLFTVEPSDIYETPISPFDNFFATSERVYDEVQSGENLFLALKRLQVSPNWAEKFSNAIGRSANLKLLLPGDVVMIETSPRNVQLANLGNKLNPSLLKPTAIELFTKSESGVAYHVRAAFASLDENAPLEVSLEKPKVYKEHTLLNGMVTNNIYGSIINNNGDAQLVNSFSDIFSWQFDFYRDTREGDSYQMIVEKNISEGRFVSYGKVLAAEYTSGGKTMRGFYFESKDQQIYGFFDNEGKSLKNAFLKAPLKLASISSRFGMRFHPVQKRLKPHNGVDYGANRGTPFMAVAKGVVTNAGYSPFNGNWIRVRHANGYETEYLHATKLAKGVRVGVKVEQGQVIGYVGRTGLATGYHLHFGMKLRGNYVNPAGQKFARNAGVPPKYMEEFNRSIEAMVIALNRQAPDRKRLFAAN